MGPGDFLSALFPEKPESLWILVWQLATRKSFWTQDVGAAAKKAAEIKRDVYVGCALSSEDRGEGKRGFADTTAAIGALWADIDFEIDPKKPIHKKPNLPIGLDAACDLLAVMPLKPSVTIHSGNGLQAWWFFSDLWIFSDAADRARAAALTRGWVELLQSHGAARGYAVDSVGDLARVLRIPGTLNGKGETLKPVKVLHGYPALDADIDRRYTIDDFDAFVTASARPAQPRLKLAGAAPLLLHPDAEPPSKKFYAISENEERFRVTWDQKRRDFRNKPGADESPSVYDMSLANMAAKAQWSDQDICDLLIAWRRKHGHPLKLDRMDYYQRTIATARMGVTEDARTDDFELTGEAVPPVKKEARAAAPQIAESAQPDNPDAADAPPADKRTVALRALSATFKFRVIRVVKLMAVQPEYKIETEIGNIELGGIATITSCHLFRNQIAAATGRLIHKTKFWDRTAQLLLDACEEQSIGDEATDEGAGLAWLTAYLEQYDPAGGVEAEAVKAKMPFVRDGRVHFFLASLRHWIKTSPHGEGAISAKELGKRLRACGCKPLILAVKGSTRSVWIVDAEVSEKMAARDADRPDAGAVQ